LDKHDLV